ncbi:MAG: TRAP transporter small permease [Kiritimatiellae bacterium]|nr:TRAP transporter small permease [Kiritimatiellia bacterium]
MREKTKQNISKKSCAGTAFMDRAADTLLATLSAVIICIVLAAVFFRYVLNHSLSWSDEMVRYLFVWFTMLGAAVTLREREHIRVDFFVEKLSARHRRWAEVAMLACVSIFHAVLIVLGACWVWSTRGSYTSALQWPLNLLFYAALPCSATLGLWYAVRRMIHGEFTEGNGIDDKPTAPEHGGDACNS